MIRKSAERRKAQELVAGRKRPRKLPWQAKGLSRVERVIKFLEFLPITKGIRIGKKLELLPDQRRFIEDVYGSSEIQIGVFSEPRGNGKTGMLAGLGLCHLLGPESEPRGECYSAAVNRLQSGLMFEEMVAIIRAVPEFQERVEVHGGGQRRCIEVMEGDGKGSRYEALSSDAKRGHGLAPSWWAYDELAQTSDRQLLDALITGQGKRKSSLGFVISTQAASDDHPLSELIDHSSNDSSMVCHVRSAPKDADPFDEAVIRAANPALGIFLKERDVFAEAKRAKEIASHEASFRNLRLNQRIQAATDLLTTPGDWARCKGPIDEAIFRDGRPVYGGLDLSGRLDLTALVLACEDDERNIHLMPIAWTPEKTMVNRWLRDHVDYPGWVEHGLLRATPGLSINYDYVVADIAKTIDGMNVVQVAFDTWHKDSFEQALGRAGYQLPLVPFVQGWKSYTPAVSNFRAAVIDGKVRHGEHKVLTWCVFNTQLVHSPGTPQENFKPDKLRPYGRIDLAVAAIMAIGALTTDQPSMPFDAAMIIG